MESPPSPETFFLDAMKAPPLLVSYSSLDDYLAALQPDLRQQYGSQVSDLVDKGLPPVVSSHCLGTLFGYTPQFVNAMMARNWRYYRTFKVPKGKGKREITAPKVGLKAIQKWFGFHLAKRLTFGDSIYGFIAGRSAVDAAGFHSGANWVYSVDIENFFQTTPIQVVEMRLIEIGYSAKAANLISKLCCYKDSLAQGSPASPVLSNLVMRAVDSELVKIAKRHDVKLTRYADDIVFSGTGDFSETLRSDTNRLFSNTCWQLSSSKENFAKLPQRLKVHGLLVHGQEPRLTKGYRNKIRAYKHLLRAQKVREKDVARLLGHVKYAKSVDDYKK